ncbi:MAG: symmetrical bis(5'-nucleosyl)-tetraphosphatase [Steroidobacteraceae bacterium]
MARWGIGDLQGCSRELETLLERIRYRSDRDELWFTGDLVNRGPASLAALRRVHELRANVRVVLGNHDLHLLAIALVPGRAPRRSDTLNDVLAAPDRETLLAWLLELPLIHHEAGSGDLLVHAGLLPQWNPALATALAAEVCAQLRHDPVGLLTQMYGDQPDHWDPALAGMERWRLIVNACTRLRFCTAEGRIDLKRKGAPGRAADPWMPWFSVPQRQSAAVRVIFGHWSALGLFQAPGLLGLDTGCVWGGTLTAVNLDDPQVLPVQVASGTHVPLEE